MESDLIKQLEDKKKELKQDKALGIGNRIYRLKAEIAILEQAIAEMQKRDKIWEEEFLRAINLLPMEDNHNFNRNTITGFLKNAIEVIKNIQSQQKQNGESQSMEGNEKSVNLSAQSKDDKTADISNLLQKQRQEIFYEIEEIFKEVGWMEDNGFVKNFKAFSQGAWLDIDKIKELYNKIQQLNQPKTEQ